MENYISERAKIWLKEQLRERGVNVSSELDILNHLENLTVTDSNESVDGNTVSTYVPLKVKKAVFRMLYPNGYYEVSAPRVNEAGNWTVECSISNDGHPLVKRTTEFLPFAITEKVAKKQKTIKGEKKEIEVSVYTSQCAIGEFETENACYIACVNTLTGRALTRALADIGIGMFEMSYEDMKNDLKGKSKVGMNQKITDFTKGIADID